nr:hypothetical protein [Chitinophagaceae bacterium]
SVRKNYGTQMTRIKWINTDILLKNFSVFSDFSEKKIICVIRDNCEEIEKRIFVENIFRFLRETKNKTACGVFQT